MRSASDYLPRQTVLLFFRAEGNMIKKVHFRERFMKILKLLISILPPLFWGLIIFGFEEPYIAILSIISAIIHECGHIIFMEKSGSMRAVLSGFRIKAASVVTYRQKILGYLGGPLANLILSLALIPFSHSEYLRMLAILNLATAMSNLLPIEGYDGYGIVKTILEIKEDPSIDFTTLSCVSGGLILCFTLFSLYLMDRVGGGYWIFAIFFSFLIKIISRGVSEKN